MAARPVIIGAAVDEPLPSAHERKRGHRHLHRLDVAERFQQQIRLGRRDTCRDRCLVRLDVPQNLDRTDQHDAGEGSDDDGVADRKEEDRSQQEERHIHEERREVSRHDLRKRLDLPHPGHESAIPRGNLPEFGFQDSPEHPGLNDRRCRQADGVGELGANHPKEEVQGDGEDDADGQRPERLHREMRDHTVIDRHGENGDAQQKKIAECGADTELQESPLVGAEQFGFDE
jgi:hypothetical protein